MKRLFTMLIVLSIGMTVGFGQVIDDFETDIGNWDDPNFSGSTTGLDASSSITVSTEQAYTGASSGKVDLVDDTAVSDGYFVRMTNRVDQVAFDSKVGFWVYTAAQDLEFRLVIWDNGTGGDGYEAGPYWSVAAPNTWEYFELDLVNDVFTGWITGTGEINSTDVVTIESLQFNTTTDADAVFYIDDLGVPLPPPPPAVFFSEYLEGSSNNKALEIYNGTGIDLDMANVAVFRLNNGATTGADTTLLTGTVTAGDVFVIGNSSAIQAILDESDTLGTATYYNGDDYVALVYDANSDGVFDLATETIDAIGVLGEDPGSAWDVAGVAGATNEQTLIRKFGITSGSTDWASSAGTDADNSEWIVKEQDFIGSLGSHPYVPAAPTPTVDAANVISMFSNAYTDVTVDTWSAGWDQADVSDVLLDSNDTKLYENLVFAGIEFTSQTIDASGMTHFHMDVWSPDAFDNGEAFLVKLVDFGADGAWSGGDDVEHELTFTAPTMMSGGWVSLDMPLADFTNLTTTGHLAQLIISGNPNTVYVDNVYFYSDGPALSSVTFNVDMNFQITLGNFVAGTDFMDVAGSFNDWGADDRLTDDDADGVYSGTFMLPEGAIEYKFRINGNWDTSESLPSNRMYTVVAGDNNIPVVWYSDQEPAPPTNVEVFVQVDMTVQLLNGNFDPGAGDLIVIRGNHDNYGNWGGAIQMTLDPEQTNIYTYLSSFDNVPIGSGYEYKFVILTGGDPEAAIWESSPNRTWIATGEEEDTDENGYGEILQEVAYFSDVTPNDIITQDVTVTFSVDISSAWRALDNGDTLYDTQTGSDGIGAWSEVNGVTINGVLSQWWDWGIDLTCVGPWAMTQTDDAGYKYSFSYVYTAGQAKSQTFKYGINSLDNESGFGNDHVFDVDDTNPTFALAENCFGELNTDENIPFPQACGPTSVESLPGIPTSYALSQNYPNPFNPTTTISFALPEANNVTLTIYNALGQEIRSLKTDYLNAGNYSVTWDGLDNAGNMIPSGLYIYTMSAGSQNLSKKMLMLK